jgi:hypothetical protein
MSQPYYTDKLLAKNLAIDSVLNEDIIATEQFWRVIEVFKVKLEKHSLGELHLLKSLFKSISHYKPAFNIDVSAVILDLIDKQINKLE